MSITVCVNGKLLLRVFHIFFCNIKNVIHHHHKWSSVSTVLVWLLLIFSLINAHFYMKQHNFHKVWRAATDDGEFSGRCVPLLHTMFKQILLSVLSRSVESNTLLLALASKSSWSKKWYVYTCQWENKPSVIAPYQLNVLKVYENDQQQASRLKKYEMMWWGSVCTTWVGSWINMHIKYRWAT